MKTYIALLVACWAGLPASFAQTPAKEPQSFIPAPFDRYFARRVAEISAVDWQSAITPENWPETQARMRHELQGMLGLDPWPAHGALESVITGKVQGDGYLIEKLYFQSLPGLYVTANLYRPLEVKQPLPAILIVCGHSKVVQDGVSFGNKTAVEHKGAWYARHGYVALAIDTIEPGRNSRRTPRNLPRGALVVAVARLHAGRRRGLERHPRAGLSRRPARKSIGRALA